MQELNEIVPFAMTNYRNQERRFGIKADDRRRHMYIIGKTGMGKTTLLENMAISDIQAGRGIAIVDPHGQFAEKMIDFVPVQRINDVIYFNAADYDYPIAFNILERVEPQYKHLVADGLVGVFKKIWADSWGPRLEYILRNTILALLDFPSSTLLGVTRMLVDKNYRRKVVNQVQDPVVRSFWVNEYANYSENFRNEAISPIQNKVGQFLSSSLIRNIIGQPKSKINIREVMDKGKILLMNIGKGKVGEENSALLGAMMITKIQLAAMSRADISEHERRDFYLYIDEFQNFSTESFANILSEARKYRLNLIMAHQYITQMEEEVRDAVFGNVGTIIAFRVGAMDAEFMEPEFQPVFAQLDLVNLTKYEVYLKLMIDGVASQAFSAKTLSPIEDEVPKYPETREKVIKASRERYANDRLTVEEKINRWSGMDQDQQQQAQQQFQPPRQQQRGQFVPFDRRRPPENQIRTDRGSYDNRYMRKPAKPWENFSRRFPPKEEVRPVTREVPASISLNDALKQQPQQFYRGHQAPRPEQRTSFHPAAPPQVAPAPANRFKPSAPSPRPKAQEVQEDETIRL